MTTEKYLTRMYWLLNTIQSKSEVKLLERQKALNLSVPTDSEKVQTAVSNISAEAKEITERYYEKLDRDYEEENGADA